MSAASPQDARQSGRAFALEDVDRRPGRARQPGGGPSGSSPLIRSLRAKQPDLRRVAGAWHERFERDPPAALAEAMSLMLVVADAPSHVEVGREEIQDREPADVVQQLVAALALEASEKGADFTQHWLVSRERGAQRVRESYPALWRELTQTAPHRMLLDGLLQMLRDWTLALSECQFRSLRHVATVAALNIVDGLGSACQALQELCDTADVQIRDAEAQGANDRRSTLVAERDEAARAVSSLSAARDALGVALLSRRAKDVDPEIRRSCFEAMRRWAGVDAATFLEQQWTRYLHFGMGDRDPKVRSAVFAVLHDLLRDDPNVPAQIVAALIEHSKPKILARCHDVDPAVGAAAVRCVSSIAAREMLAESEYDPVIDLVWDSDAQRRVEAAAFISRFVLTEDILDYPTKNGPHSGGLMPTGAGGGAVARRRVTMLLQFLVEYSEGHFRLVDRFAAALWRRASCIEDWEAMAGLMLQTAGDGALSGPMHIALVHLAEAVAHLAADDAAAGPASDGAHRAEAVLDRAARALAPRLPALLAACQAEPAAMRRAASLCRHILGHCAGRQGRGICEGLISARQGEAVAEALKAAFVRQPDPDTLEHCADAMAHLLDLADTARGAVLGLADGLHTELMGLVPRLSADASQAGAADIPPADALLAVATRLRILAKACDVSLCRVRGFCASLLGLLDDRADALARGAQPVVGPLLAVTLLELLVLVLMRHAAALIQPDPLPHCVVHDPIDRSELQLAPTAARDFCKVVAALLQADGVPQVRAAAFASAVAVLTAWSNAVSFTDAARGDGAKQDEAPWLRLEDELAEALCGHLGDVLTEANGVPPDSGRFVSEELGTTANASAFSQLFWALQQSLSAYGVDEEASCALSDSERVRLAALSCTLVGACRHPELADSTLPAVVLAQALSPREDMQEVAWALLRRMRKEAGMQAESGDAFFKILLHAVYLVHKDAGVDVARDLSSRLLFHVGVGKLAPVMQVSLVAALQAGVLRALSSTDTSAGLLEALTPWVTKHCIDDSLARELAAWVENEAKASAESSEAQGDHAGAPAFLAALRATIARGERAEASRAPRPAMAAIAEAPSPEPQPPAKRAAGGGSTPRGAKAPRGAAEAHTQEDGTLEATAADTEVVEEPSTQIVTASASPPASTTTPAAGKRRRTGPASQRHPAPHSQRNPVGPARALGPRR